MQKIEERKQRQSLARDHLRKSFGYIDKDLGRMTVRDKQEQLEILMSRETVAHVVTVLEVCLELLDNDNDAPYHRKLLTAIAALESAS